jgi:precorrin-6x reductase
MHQTVVLNVFIATPFHVRKVIAIVSRSNNPGKNRQKNERVYRRIDPVEKIENKCYQREFRKKRIINMNGRILHGVIPKQ